MGRILSVVTIAVALVIPAVAIPAAAIDDVASATDTRGPKSAMFLVRMSADPVVAHPATAPERGRKLDPSDRRVQRYVADLDASHDGALDRAGVPRTAKVYDYRYSYNGFAARLTPAEVRRLRADPAVAHVAADTINKPQTDRSGDFLDLNGPGELYSRLPAGAGEDVIVGVIDTGIWPEHPSFSDQNDFAFRPGRTGDATRVYDAPPAGWHGACEAGEQFSTSMCNNKLIGARYFIDGYRNWGVIQQDYESPRDADGHGSHTAGTAAGNALPADAVKLFGVTRGPISGIAPRARVAAYKVCWNGDAGGCPTTDTVAAIDTALADGVDVINYSIGSNSPLLGEDDIAFLFAERGGVVIAGSAGNEGPGSGTVGAPHLTPWTIAVGASTHSRTFEATLTIGPKTFRGASVTNGVGPAPIVDAAAVDTVASGDGTDGLCLAGTLPSSAVAGNIVLCKRGITARVEKSLRVQQAGGVGMVLYNAVSPQETVTDNHYIPSVHLTLENGLAVKALLGEGANATLSGGAAAEWQGDVMAAFSSRGPNRAYPDLVTPDVTAPGVNILAAASPTPMLGAPGQLFQSISGTSMSGPHVAGTAALLKQLHPDWTPAMVKSSLMTSGQTAGVTKEDGTTPADPFDMGGGRIRPTSAADPGLVYESGYVDYRNFLCTAEHLGCTTTFTGMDAIDLNLASIGVSQLTGSRVVTRTVTNVGTQATYRPTVIEPAGVDVKVSPSRITLAPGESATYTVTITTDARENPTYDAWSFGSLTWSDGSHAVRSPVAVKPVKLGFPAEIVADVADGGAEWQVQFGYGGDFSATAAGPVPATVSQAVLEDDPDNDIFTALVTGTGIDVYPVDVSAADFARFALYTSETGSPDNDLDLFVFADANGNGTFEHDEDEMIGESASGTSDEKVDVDTGDHARLFVVVHGWQTSGGAPTMYRLFQWVVGSTTPAAMTVTAPTNASLGAAGTIEVAWGALASGQRHLGLVRYDDGTDALGYTVVSIDP